MAKFKLLKYLHICLNQQWPFHVDYTWLRDLLESTSASEHVTVVLEHHFREATFGDLEISPFRRPSYRADWPADKQAKYAETVHVSLTSFWREQQMITLCRMNASAQHDSAASHFIFQVTTLSWKLTTAKAMDHLRLSFLDMHGYTP